MPSPTDMQPFLRRPRRNQFAPFCLPRVSAGAAPGAARVFKALNIGRPRLLRNVRARGCAQKPSSCTYVRTAGVSRTGASARASVRGEGAADSAASAIRRIAMAGAFTTEPFSGP